MENGNPERRLAAIVSADVVGYSRLMGVDEEGTLKALRAHRDDLIDPEIFRHSGRIVKTMGDGLLLEFPSIVAAIECAISLQSGMMERNLNIPEDVAICFRIGVHVGDVIIEGDDIFGDGVNIAARVEALGRPNGVTITDDAYRQVRDKIDQNWEDGGSHTVKNIARPLQIWHYSQLQTKKNKESAKHLESDRVLPDKPSIAVLAFDNMSGDPEQDYFSDGIAEDIITALSRNRGFFVIARNSSFAYKGDAINLKHVSRELGVRYILEGSTRKASNRIRITAQLIDALHGNHIWAEKYDRELTDIFAVQDEITHNIVAAVAPEMLDAEMLRVRHMDVHTLQAWEFAIRAQWHLARHTKEDNAEALRFALKSTELDPGASLGFSIAAFAHVYIAINKWSDTPSLSIQAANDLASKAVTLDARDAMAQAALGVSEIYLLRHDDAIARLRVAIELNPNFPWAHGDLGIALLYSGKGDEAMEPIKEAIRLSPRDQFNFLWLYVLGFACFISERYEEGLYWTEKSIQENGIQPGAYRIRAACLSKLGRLDEAKDVLSKFLLSAPDISAEIIRSQIPLKRPEDLDRYIDSLVLAGLPT